MAEVYVHRIRVRYAEVDMQQVVFNAHYLTYCDDAVEEWMRHLGVDPAAWGWDFMVKKAVIEWQGSAAVAEEMAIAVEAARWGTTSFDVAFRGSVGGRPVFSCVTTYVGVRRGTTETMAPPPAVRAALAG